MSPRNHNKAYRAIHYGETDIYFKIRDFFAKWRAARDYYKIRWERGAMHSVSIKQPP